MSVGGVKLLVVGFNMDVLVGKELEQVFLKFSASLPYKPSLFFYSGSTIT